MNPISTYARLAALAALVVSLAAGGWWCYSQGKKTVMAEWTAEKLVVSENARLRERAAQISNERVDRDYQTAKARAALDQRITDDRLREFEAASADTTASPACGADGPDRVIANQCAIALATLDRYAQGLAGKATALQGYTREVCLK